MFDNLESLDPKRNASGVIDSEVTYVPKGGVTAQHIMKFRLHELRKRSSVSICLLPKCWEKGTILIIYFYTKGIKIPDKVTMLDIEITTINVQNHRLQHRIEIDYQIYEPDNESMYCRPNPDLIIRGER